MPPRRKKPVEQHIVYRMAILDKRALTLLSPKSRGFGMNAPMRLIALLLMLWDEDTTKGRIHWDHDLIADRTGLTVSQVAKALDQLRQIHLVRETAAGPKLNWAEFEKHTVPAWRDAFLLRPKPLSGFPLSDDTNKENSNDGPEVAREEGSGDAGSALDEQQPAE